VPQASPRQAATPASCAAPSATHRAQSGGRFEQAAHAITLQV
jgi:hypothetical protein